MVRRGGDVIVHGVDCVTGYDCMLSELIVSKRLLLEHL